MKRFIATFMMMAMMAVMLPLAAFAQTYTTKRIYKNGRYQTVRVYEKQNVYDRHRNLINIGVGTGAGALIGALIGGKKGALIGTAIGAGGSALYSYKINPKDK